MSETGTPNPANHRSNQRTLFRSKSLDMHTKCHILLDAIFCPPWSFPPDAVDFLSLMHELIENLVKLQSIELDRTRLRQDLRALPSEVAKAQAELAAAERKSADLSAALNREDALRTKLEREIDAFRKKVARFREQLDSVNTSEQAVAIEHEIQFSGAEADRLENEEYTSLERTEAQEASLAQARAKVESLSEALEGVRGRVAARQQELEAELATLDAERETVRAALDPEWVARFDRIASTRGTAMARAENQQCTGCRMGVRPQTWNQLREGELLTCDSCSRLLYWDPAMQPIPKAPQAEPVPGAGRAPRKSHQAGA